MRTIANLGSAWVQGVGAPRVSVRRPLARPSLLRATTCGRELELGDDGTVVAERPSFFSVHRFTPDAAESLSREHPVVLPGRFVLGIRPDELSVVRLPQTVNETEGFDPLDDGFVRCRARPLDLGSDV